MTTVTSAEFQKNFGTYKQKALEAPVHITIHRKPTLVMISRERYEELTGQGEAAAPAVPVAPKMAARPKSQPKPAVDPDEEKRNVDHLNRVADGASQSGVFFKEGNVKSGD